MVQGLRKAVAVLYNVTGDQLCFQLEMTGPAGGPGLDTWMYQTCTELMPQEQPIFPANGITDMFWDQGAPRMIVTRTKWFHKVPAVCGALMAGLIFLTKEKHYSMIK